MSTSAGGLIIRQEEPRNLEFPFDRLDSYLTPVESFYIRSHFHAPTIQPDSYRLTMDGAVKNPFAITLKELKSLPGKTIVATLECAGNSRVFLVPQRPGAQWELGAVGNAEWTGVPLATLLDRAGLNRNAREVVLEGADRGLPAELPRPPEAISYSRSVPLDKALDDVLVAYAMNGSDLPQDHGFPVRAIVPGHYGMASVKWLTHVRVLEEQFQGYWQTIDYGFWDEVGGIPVRRPLSEMRIKSEIARPSTFEVLPKGRTYTIYGAAWCGTGDVVSVELTTDGGRSWANAKFLDPIRPHGWRRWNYDWEIPDRPGRFTLKSRAKNTVGESQPDEFNERYFSYVVNHTLPIEVVVQ
ncbi:MAG: sulfite oxidase-like oxidoreductase [Candidatus Angelobacter sp.]|nr:sulfite oxidase-like oxidoreductase [Candidatus Angelobacter sp.]